MRSYKILNFLRSICIAYSFTFEIDLPIIIFPYQGEKNLFIPIPSTSSMQKSYCYTLFHILPSCQLRRCSELLFGECIFTYYIYIYIFFFFFVECIMVDCIFMKNQCVISCICIGIIKNNHNYTVQLVHFFRRYSNYRWYKLTSFFNYTFSSICNGFLLYMCIYDLEFN